MSTAKYFLVNSEFSEPGSVSDSDFTIRVKDSSFFEGPQYVALHSATIPLTNYIVPRGKNHVFRFSQNGGAFQTVTLNETIGTPDTSSFASDLATKLNSVSIGGNIYSVIYDPHTFRYQIQVSGGAGKYFSLDFTPIPTQGETIYMAILSGFLTTGGIYTSSTSTANPGVLNSAIAIDLSGSKNFFLEIEGLNMNSVISNEDVARQRFVIPINQDPATIISYTNPNWRDELRPCANPNRGSLRFRLVDELNETVDLNGLTTRFVLAFVPK